MQHTALNARFKKTVRLFVLEPIEDAEERAKLRADYYLEESSEPQQIFCVLQDPKTLGLNVKETYVLNGNHLTTYCFRLPDK
jgi:hypothetical protein